MTAATASAGAASASVAPVLQLERELDRAIEAFWLDHERLLRTACAASGGMPTADLALVTVFGHAVRRLVESRGRIATERLALCLCEQLAQASEERRS
jgi:hypothetical protein